VAKLTAQMGAITVQVKDDRAELRGRALREWKEACSDLIAGAAALLIVDEEIEDGE
jgi:hypothetical protein